jgi:Flp pilus assembly pilin Flp
MNQEMNNPRIVPRCRTPEHERQKGASSIEYALIAALISVFIIGAVQTASDGNLTVWNYWAGKFIAAVESAMTP